MQVAAKSSQALNHCPEALGAARGDLHRKMGESGEDGCGSQRIHRQPHSLSKRSFLFNQLRSSGERR